MVEVFALVIYSVQWLGVVLGVGAEVVLLVAHLMALHQHKPEWLASVPAVRAAQGIGLVLIVASGGGAVAYQFLIGQPDLLLLPVFSFKWALIGALALGFFLEKRLTRGRALLEGFAGATWLALFLVHSIAPVSPWQDLGVFYGGWIVVFGVVWGAFVLLMKYTGGTSAKPFSQKSSGLLSEPKNGSAGQTFAQKVSPPPVHAAAPAPVFKPMPVVVAAVPPKPVVKVKKESLWHKLAAFFAKKPKVIPVAPVVAASVPPKLAPLPPIVKTAPIMPPPAPKVVAPPPPMPSVALAKEGPKPAPAPAPVVAAKPPVAPAPAKPANLPAIEPLELMAPHAVPPAAKPSAAPAYAPDYNNMPGLRVMPQRPEDLHQENRGPLVQPA